MSELPLKFPDDPLAYELRIIDDDEEYYCPCFEMSSLDRDCPLDSFPSLALVDVKNYC